MGTEVDTQLLATSRRGDSPIALLFSVMITLRGVQGFTNSYGYTWLQLVADVALAAAILLVLVRPAQTRRRLNGAGLLAIAFIGLCAATGLPRIVDLPNLTIYGIRALCLALLAVVVIQTAGLEEVWRRRLARLLLLVLNLNFAAALYQAVFGLSSRQIESVLESGSTFVVGTQYRLIGLQPTGQDLSLLSGATAAWSLVQVLRVGWRESGPLLWITMATSSVTTLLVLQRSALVGVASALLIVSLAYFTDFITGKEGIKSPILPKLFAISALGLAAIGLFASIAPAQTSEALTRLGSLFGLEDDVSLNYRRNITIPVALMLIRANPFGYGPGASGPVAASFPSQTPLSAYPLGGVNADNGYVFVTLQLGVLGLIVFSALLVAWMATGSLIKDGPNLKWEARAAVGFVVGAMATGSFWGLGNTMSMVLILGSLSYVNSQRELLPRPRQSQAF